jgi:hypothetical protein
MATERANDLHAFKTFIDEQLAIGATLNLDEALARWKHENEGAKNKASLISSTTALQENPGEWARRLQAWVESLPARPTTMDDSRESIYAGRGE